MGIKVQDKKAKKVASKKSSSKNARSAADQRAMDSVLHANDAPKKKLPKGWRQATDPKTGRVYFWNKVTKETKWEL